MKKAMLSVFAAAAMTAAAFSGSAYAADMAVKAAPPPLPAPVMSWTGFYIFGGVGGGIWDADTFSRDRLTGVPLSLHQTQGGDGWFGTVGFGYDWQISRWVVGLFADGQFGSMRGNVTAFNGGVTGRIKLEDSWAAGARVGYLIAPNVLSYVNGGYSGSHWNGTTLLDSLSGLPVGLHTNSFNRNGWFVGGGVENNLDIFGISAPGWFMKTEYRGAYYDRANINAIVDGTNLPFGTTNLGFKPFVQTISTSLVYRFNWTGPVVAKY